MTKNQTGILKLKSSITRIRNSSEQFNSRYKLKEETDEQQKLCNMKNRDKN